MNILSFFSSVIQLTQKSFAFLFEKSTISFIYDLAIVLTILFLSVTAYCAVRILEIRKKEHEHLHEEIHEYAIHKAEIDKKGSSAQGSRNMRWQNVLKYLSSESESDWKLAIIEADSMLEDLTDILELDGNNIGEKLKSTNKDKFKSLDDAWEAHIVRNKIAHEGLSFHITQREAQRIVYLYEKVFREFGHI